MHKAQTTCCWCVKGPLVTFIPASLHQSTKLKPYDAAEQLPRTYGGELPGLNLTHHDSMECGAEPGSEECHCLAST